MTRQVAVPCYLRMGQDEWDALLEEWDAAGKAWQAAPENEKTVRRQVYDGVLAKIENVRRMVARDFFAALRMFRQEYPDEFRTWISQTVTELLIEMSGGTTKDLATEAATRVIHLRNEVDRLQREVFALRSKLAQMVPDPEESNANSTPGRAYLDRRTQLQPPAGAVQSSRAYAAGHLRSGPAVAGERPDVAPQAHPETQGRDQQDGVPVQGDAGATPAAGG